MGKDLDAQLFGVWVQLGIVFVHFPFLHWGTSKSSNFKWQNPNVSFIINQGFDGENNI
jgi:hypothetical protein